jgi:hypothetical protein
METRGFICWSAAAVACGVVLTAAPIVSAGPRDKQPVKLNAADQAAARAAVLRLPELGPGPWKGGFKKPDLSPGPVCATYHPKQSDLVVTGAAESDFSITASAREIGSAIDVLQTGRMVRLDWQRSVIAPGAFRCLRTTLSKGLPAGVKIVSFRQIPFPRLGRYATAFLLLFDTTVRGLTARFAYEFIALGEGRSEISLSLSAPIKLSLPVAQEMPLSTLKAHGVKLARILVARAVA